jgi:hypothetical protein
MEETTNKTSRGYLLEKLEVIGNLLALTEHLHDIPVQDEYTHSKIGEVRELRQMILEAAFPQESVNMDYHCAFKHTLLAYIQTKECLQNRLGNSDGLGVINEQIALERIKELLLDIMTKYLQLEAEIETDKCFKCLEDAYNVKRKEGNG